MSRTISHARRVVCRGAAPRLALAAGGLLVALVGRSPALAEPPRDQEERAFYMEMTGISDRASNLGFSLARSTTGGERAGLELGRSFETRYQVAWLIPNKKGAVVLTDWVYDQSDEADDFPGSATLLPTALLAVSSLRSSVQADAHVQARSFDAAYTRDFKQSFHWRATWSLGLRYAHYEHRLEAVYRAAGGAIADRAIEEVESTAVGPRFGASLGYTFTPKWSLGAGIGFATLFGDTDHGNVSQTNIATPSALLAFTEGRNLRRTFSQVDLDLHVTFLVWKTLQVSGGYRIAEWYDARTRQLFNNSFEVARVTFDGPYLCVGYRF